jgi:AcrR family transcriptional regulator
MAKNVSDRLLEAGLKHFANQGYAGTSVQEIIDEAGVTKPTLYYYFQSKAGLFQALVDRALDERLQLMRAAAPPGKETADQLTDILAAVSHLAARKPDHLRLCFAIAFAAPGEFPAELKRHDKMIETYLFLREIVVLGLKRGALDQTFTVDELTQSYFHLVQHATAMSTFAAKTRRGGPQVPLPPPMTPRRIIELFTGGAAGRPQPHHAAPPRKVRPLLARATALAAAFILPLAAARAESSGAAPPPTTNYPSADTTPPPVMSDADITNSAPASPGIGSAPPPDLADIRAIPEAVRASHPELALVSPIADNAKNPRAIDLETCFRLTAMRDDSLKISLQDVRIAQAQMSQSIAALHRHLLHQPRRRRRRIHDLRHGQRHRNGHGHWNRFRHRHERLHLHHPGDDGQPQLRVPVHRDDELHHLQRRPELEQRRRGQRQHRRQAPDARP